MVHRLSAGIAHQAAADSLVSAGQRYTQRRYQDAGKVALFCLYGLFGKHDMTNQQSILLGYKFQGRKKIFSGAKLQYKILFRSTGYPGRLKCGYTKS